MTTAKFRLWLFGHDINIYAGEFSWNIFIFTAY